MLDIDSGYNTPYYYSASGVTEAYIRKGNSSVLANNIELNNLILHGKNLTYDAITTNNSIDKISLILFVLTYEKETLKEFDSSKDYYSLGLIDENGMVTNAGLLFSDSGISNSQVFCTRWNGITKANYGKDVIDSKEYSGSLISLLANSETFVKNHSQNSWYIKDMKRIEKDDYPIEAIREAIVNSLMHRDYQIMGSEIHIDIYDDRLEIISPGGMINGKKIQDMNIFSVPSIRRNKVITDIFSRLNFMERRGSGLARIMESYASSEVKPFFESDDMFFRVVFPNLNYNTKNKNGEINGEINDILKIIKRNSNILRKDIAIETGLSLRQVDRMIKILKENEYILREGGNKKGHWVILK